MQLLLRALIYKIDASTDIIGITYTSKTLQAIETMPLKTPLVLELFTALCAKFTFPRSYRENRLEWTIIISACLTIAERVELPPALIKQLFSVLPLSARESLTSLDDVKTFFLKKIKRNHLSLRVLNLHGLDHRTAEMLLQEGFNPTDKPKEIIFGRSSHSSAANQGKMKLIVERYMSRHNLDGQWDVGSVVIHQELQKPCSRFVTPRYNKIALVRAQSAVERQLSPSRYTSERLHRALEAVNGHTASDYFSEIKHALKAKKISYEDYADLLVDERSDRSTPLHSVLKTTNINTIKLYFRELRQVVDKQALSQHYYAYLLQKPDKDGVTPLLQATYGGVAEVVELLINELSQQLPTRDFKDMLRSCAQDSRLPPCFKHTFDDLLSTAAYAAPRGRKRISLFEANAPQEKYARHKKEQDLAHSVVII